MFMDVQNGDINVIVVKDDKFEDIIAVEKKAICDRAEEAREVETSHQTGVSDVTLVRDDHNHEDKHFEEAHKVKPEDETLYQIEVSYVTLVCDNREHEDQQFGEGHEGIEAEKLKI